VSLFLRYRPLPTSALAILLRLLNTGLVMAQSESDSLDAIHIDVQGYPLVDAIQQLVEKTEIDVAYDPKLLHWKRSNCKVDAPDIEIAFRRVLAGTGLTFRRLESGGYVVVKREKGQANSSHTVSGFLQDARSGENFVGANVYEPNQKIGTASNAFGFYSLTLPADSATIVFSYVGYESYVIEMVLTADTKVDIALDPAVLSSDGVVVAAERSAPIEERTQMSAVEIPIHQIESIPTIMGERDLVKAFQLMPGVRGGSEGSSGLFVRGGSAGSDACLA